MCSSDLVFSAPAPILTWRVVGAWSKGQRPSFDAGKAPDPAQVFQIGDRKVPWRLAVVKDLSGKVSLGDWVSPKEDVWALAYASVSSDQAGPRTLVLGSDDQIVLWVNGKQVHEFTGDRSWSADQTTLKVPLTAGVNHLYALVGNSSGPWDFSVKLSRRDPALAFLREGAPTKLSIEAYAEYASSKKGNPARGEALFRDVKGVACVKCHAVEIGRAHV